MAASFVIPNECEESRLYVENQLMPLLFEQIRYLIFSIIRGKNESGPECATRPPVIEKLQFPLKGESLADLGNDAFTRQPTLKQVVCVGNLW